MSISAPTRLVNRYLDVWHQPTEAARLAAIVDLWAVDGTHTTDTGHWRGPEEIAARVRGSYERWVAPGGHQFTAGELTLSHHDTVVFTWNMTRTDDHSVVSTGLDVVTLAPTGHIASDYQFIVN
jgi:hypothetical protein